MATATAPTQGASFLRPKYVLFGLIGLMLAYVLVHDESFLFRPQDPVWQHYHPFRWYLLPHGLAGACVILLGPLQFSDRLRRRYTALHRATGRIYIAAAMILAPLGAYIQYFEESMGETRSFTVATAIDAILLMGTTGLAFAFILKRRVQQHREWMMRSYAVAMVFIEVRVIGGLTGWDVETIVWSCVALALLVGDIAVQVHNLQRGVAAR